MFKLTWYSDSFNPSQHPTFAWALKGFTGLAFCQWSMVKSRQGDKCYIGPQGKRIKFMHTAKLYYNVGKVFFLAFQEN